MPLSRTAIHGERRRRLRSAPVRPHPRDARIRSRPEDPAHRCSTPSVLRSTPPAAAKEGRRSTAAVDLRQTRLYVGGVIRQVASGRQVARGLCSRHNVPKISTVSSCGSVFLGDHSVLPDSERLHRRSGGPRPLLKA